MNKKTKIWLFVLFAPVALIYILSPPRNLTIRINAIPQGVQEFRVRTVSSKPGFHGREFKTLDTHLIPANQNTTIPLNRDKILWFGSIYVYISHPEYFKESGETNNKYFLPSATFSPTTWQNIILSEEKLVSQQVYRPYVLAYRDLPMSHLNYHLSSVNETIIDLYLKNNDKKEIRKSFEVLISNTEQFIKGMLEDNMGEYGETKEMKDEIEKAYNLTNEIYEKIN